jgi:hypothetical protein
MSHIKSPPKAAGLFYGRANWVRSYAARGRNVAPLGSNRSTAFFAIARSLRRCWTHSEMMFSVLVTTLQL